MSPRFTPAVAAVVALMAAATARAQLPEQLTWISELRFDLMPQGAVRVFEIKVPPGIAELGFNVTLTPAASSDVDLYFGRSPPATDGGFVHDVAPATLGLGVVERVIVPRSALAGGGAPWLPDGGTYWAQAVAVTELAKYTMRMQLPIFRELLPNGQPLMEVDVPAGEPRWFKFYPVYFNTVSTGFLLVLQPSTSSVGVDVSIAVAWNVDRLFTPNISCNSAAGVLCVIGASKVAQYDPTNYVRVVSPANDASYSLSVSVGPIKAVQLPWGRAASEVGLAAGWWRDYNLTVDAGAAPLGFVMTVTPSAGSHVSLQISRAPPAADGSFTPDASAFTGGPGERGSVDVPAGGALWQPSGGPYYARVRSVEGDGAYTLRASAVATAFTPSVTPSSAPTMPTPSSAPSMPTSSVTGSAARTASPSRTPVVTRSPFTPPTAAGMLDTGVGDRQGGGGVNTASVAAGVVAALVAVVAVAGAGLVYNKRAVRARLSGVGGGSVTLGKPGGRAAEADGAAYAGSGAGHSDTSEWARVVARPHSTRGNAVGALNPLMATGGRRGGGGGDDDDPTAPE